MATTTKEVVFKKGDRVKVKLRNDKTVKGHVGAVDKTGATGVYVRVDFHPNGDKKLPLKSSWKRPSQLTKF